MNCIKSLNKISCHGQSLLAHNDILLKIYFPAPQQSFYNAFKRFTFVYSLNGDHTISTLQSFYMHCKNFVGGQGNSTVFSISVCQAGSPGSCPAQSACFRWNSITVLLTCSHQCRRLVHKRPSMCYNVCVIMHVKDP